MTGTIWTNKRKCQLNMKTDDRCAICRIGRDEEVEESHQHVLGQCQMTLEQRDNLWTELRKMWKEEGASTVALSPWFSTKSYRKMSYGLEEEMCNKGLIPKVIFRILKKDNKRLDMNIIKRKTKFLIRQNIATGYIERMKIVKEIEALEEDTNDGGTRDSSPRVVTVPADPRQRSILNFFGKR